MSNILVTGGCGFIGANLIPLLRDRGHSISILDNFSRGNINYLDAPDNYTIIDADIRNEDAVIEAAKGNDAIVHLAAYGSVVESIAEPYENFSINAEGTFRVLNAARHAGVGQILFSSTGGALIGNATPPVNEQSVPRPISPYGASKLAGEAYCSAFAQAYDMSITALRFANVVGPISWHKKGAVSAFFKAIMDGKPIHIYGDGEATRDFLYVEDLCLGIIAALDVKKAGFKTYHLAGGREVSIKELVNIACAVTGATDHPILYEAKRKGEVERNVADFELARRELGFQPKVGLEEAMSFTWDWFQLYQTSSK
jgi:UDP-glucose 4-epimerase